jgi:hypothetical protein
MRSLESRRDRELGPARDLLSSSRAAAAGTSATVARIDRLLALLDDFVAIDAQMRRLSPSTLRRLVGAGGRVARIMEGAFGRRRDTR